MAKETHRAAIEQAISNLWDDIPFLTLLHHIDHADNEPIPTYILLDSTKSLESIWHSFFMTREKANMIPNAMIYDKAMDKFLGFLTCHDIIKAVFKCCESYEARKEILKDEAKHVNDLFDDLMNSSDSSDNEKEDEEGDQRLLHRKISEYLKKLGLGL